MRKTLLALVTISFFSFTSIKQQFAQPADVNLANVFPKGSLTRDNFEDSVRRLYDHIDLASAELNYEVFKLGMIGYHSLRSEGKVGKRNLLTIVDFSKASTEKRFYTIDLDSRKLVFHSLVAHGRATGENLAKTFSNRAHSNASSLGFYVTGETYVGSKGYSLRLDGQEKQYNGNLRSRAVVIHAADYVSDSWIRRYGRLGRSQGCPALPREMNRTIIDTIKNKTVIFAYYPENKYLSSSAYLNFNRMIDGLETDVAATTQRVSAQSASL